MLTKWGNIIFKARQSRYLGIDFSTYRNQFKYRDITGAERTPSGGSQALYYGYNQRKTTSSVNNDTIYAIAPDNLTALSNLYSTTSSAVLPVYGKIAWDLGTGTTEPTDEDYALESPIRSGIVTNLISHSETLNNGVLTVKIMVSITNTSNSEIAISECGYFISYGPHYATSWLPTSDYYLVLVDRSLLLEPLVLQPNESGTIEYSVSVNL